jgi:3-phosphoshikimate 1-carboxyvinyltransferase
MRLLAGLLAPAPFETVLLGDESLSGRPMERVAEPLRAMGADVRTTDGHAPIVVRGATLRGIEIEPRSERADQSVSPCRPCARRDDRAQPAPTRDHAPPRPQRAPIVEPACTVAPSSTGVTGGAGDVPRQRS